MDSPCVLPVLVLRPADVERAAADVAQVHIARTGGDFAGQVAVGRAVVAAAARLVEHQLGAVLGFQEGHQFEGGGGGDDFVNHACLLVGMREGGRAQHKGRVGQPPHTGVPEIGGHPTQPLR